MKKFVVFLMVLVLCLSFVPAAMAVCEVCGYDDGGNCMMLGVGKEASPTGFPIILHNEDDGGRLMVKHGWVPTTAWPAGATLPTTPDRATIPQVPNTYGFFWTSVKGFGDGLQNADSFLNDKGVSIMSNSNANSKETITTATLVNGGIEYNLRRIVAERATSARHAVDIIIDMLETYGYAPSGRAYTVSDNKEIWQVQISRGNKYVAFRVPDDHVIVMPNHYTIKNPDEYAPAGPYGDKGADVIYPGSGYGGRPKLDPSDPNHLIGYAISMGWYVPVISGDYSDFDFARAYQAVDSYRAIGNTYRHAFAADILTGGNAGALPASTSVHAVWAAGREFYPTYKVDGKVSINTLRKAISFHYEGTAIDDARTAPGNEPHNGGSRRICTGATIQSTMVQFYSDINLTTLWIAYGRPCLLPYIPFHPLLTRIPDIVTLEDPAESLKNHLTTDPNRGLYVDNKWQKFREFMYMMEMVYEQHIGEVSAILAEYSDLATTANSDYLIEASPYASSAAIFDQSWYGDALNRLQIYIGSKPLLGIPVYPNTYVDRQNTAQTQLDITFEMPAGKTPRASSMRIRLGGASGADSYLNPVVNSLTDLDNGKWKITVTKADLTGSQGVPSASAPGEYEFVIGGRTTDDESFTGIVVLLFTNGAAAYAVKFVDPDGTTLKTQFVEQGMAATAPQTPIRGGYVFTGWDRDYTNVTGDITVTAQYAYAVPVTGVALDKTQLNLSPGSADILVATVEPGNASNKNVTWTSSAANVAAVSSNGIVTVLGVGNGTAVITATTVDGEHIATCTVNVATKPVDNSGGRGGGGCSSGFGYLALAMFVVPLLSKKKPE